jgi:hypothetical protein
LLDEHLQAIARDGYTILKNVVDPGWMDEIIDAIASIGRSEKIVPATNEFEGVETLRLYNLLATNKKVERYIFILCKQQFSFGELQRLEDRF